MSVRFGNVLGSRGSFIHAFRSQIENGGPVTVTDRDVTRYFMTIPEAVQLVIQAGAIGNNGDALILDMGKPVRIADVAKQMIKQSRKDIKIIYSGLRPGEKLHEELIGHQKSWPQQATNSLPAPRFHESPATSSPPPTSPPPPTNKSTSSPVGARQLPPDNRHHAIRQDCPASGCVK